MHVLATRSAPMRADRSPLWPAIAAVAIMVGAAVIIAVLVLAVGRPAAGPAATGARVSLIGLRYQPDEIAVRPGRVEVELHNDDAVTHTFTIPSLGVDVAVGAGESATAVFDARYGSHEIVCTIPGHLEGGMRAQLRVR